MELNLRKHMRSGINYHGNQMTTMALADQRRIDILARARELPDRYCEDRRSVYWDNGIRPKDYTKTTSFVLTNRQNQLVYSKSLHPNYVPNRSSATWPITTATLSAPCTPRLKDLSIPKQLPMDYKPPKPICQVIPRRALSAQPSSRLSRLAKHKTFPELKIKNNSEWDWGEWSSDINRAILNATPTPRVIELSSPKRPPKSYQPSKNVKWPIPKAALLHTAGERLSKLANPKMLTGYQEDYDPNTYRVSKAALLAQASPCIENLAKPIPRKCRNKKNV